MASTQPEDGAVQSSSRQSASESWRNPSMEKQKKYGIVALGDDFAPTKEEQKLLDMYETIRAYEKRAANLKQDAALKKLQERNETFLQKKQRKNKRNRGDKKRSRTESGDERDDMDEDKDSDQEGDNSSEDDEDLERSKTEKSEAQLEEMRRKVQEAKEKAGLAEQEKQEQLIAEHLTEKTMDDDEEDEVVLQRKIKKPKTDMDPSVSLLANMGPTETPPHEFSSSLGLESSQILFPRQRDDDDDEEENFLAKAITPEDEKGVWTPPEGVAGPNDGAFLRMLDDFDMEATATSQAKNTLAIKFSVPSDSRRFSLNIANADQPQHHFDSVLFHFNPRQRERGGQVVMNDKKEGMWGQALSIPLSQLPVLFGKEACTLMIQIHSEGFDVFLDKQHCARLEHRQDLLTSENSKLCLQFPSTDDYGSPENWKVYQVWWGYKPIMASSEPNELAKVAGVNSFNSIHPRKLFIRGLPKIKTNADVELRRAELERAFAKYGGSRGIVNVVVYNHKTYASVEMETDRLADLALQEMSSVYQLNRARRTKHEALQEERMAKEGGGRPGTGHGGGWD